MNVLAADGASRQSEEHDNRPIQPHDILIVEATNAAAGGRTTNLELGYSVSSD